MLLILPVLLTVVLGVMMIFLSKADSQPSTSTPFECGFEPFNPSYSTFSMNYFMIIILFLVFDVEIILVLPLCLSPMALSTASSYFMLTVVIWAFILGLLYEVLAGVLYWAS